MIDTGSELNFIKETAVRSRVRTNHRKIYDLVGIGPGIIKTLGEFTIKIKGIVSVSNRT